MFKDASLRITCGSIAGPLDFCGPNVFTDIYVCGSAADPLVLVGQMFLQIFVCGSPAYPLDLAGQIFLQIFVFADLLPISCGPVGSCGPNVLQNFV